MACYIPHYANSIIVPTVIILGNLNKRSASATGLAKRLKDKGEKRRPGRPKGSGGRPKGSLTKRTVEVMDQLEKLGADPISWLAYTMLDDRKALGLPHAKKDPSILYEYRLKAAIELCSYVAPKRKAIDVTTGGKTLEETFAAAVAARGKRK